MTSDIVARLRVWADWLNERCPDTAVRDDLREAADEIERLRRELGQVSDADSWVSKVDAALLDNLLNWCEWNAGDSHRALQRLVNDRARLRAEVIRLREKGCARDQRTTQYCGEAVALQREIERLLQERQREVQ